VLFRVILSEAKDLLLSEVACALGARSCSSRWSNSRSFGRFAPSG